MTAVTVGTRPSAPEPVEFSTIGLPEERRIELWEGHNADALIGLRCRTLTATVLEATEVNVQLEHVHLARVLGSSHVVERDVEMIRRRPAESVALFFSLAGEAFFYHDDGVRTVRPGQMLMCDADRPFMRGFSQGLEELVLKIPRGVFAGATGIDDVPRPVVVNFGAGGDPFAQALARQVGGAACRRGTQPAQEQTLLELVAALAGRNGQEHLAAAHRAAAYGYIEQHLADPALSAVAVAAAVGISTRHLSRVIAGDDTTFPQYVLGRRLDAARKLLEKPDVTPMTIAEVARHCGFTSAAHFSGAFTRYFGERAGEARRRAVAARAIPLG